MAVSGAWRPATLPQSVPSRKIGEAERQAARRDGAMRATCQAEDVWLLPRRLLEGNETRVLRRVLRLGGTMANQSFDPHHKDFGQHDVSPSSVFIGREPRGRRFNCDKE